MGQIRPLGHNLSTFTQPYVTSWWTAEGGELDGFRSLHLEGGVRRSTEFKANLSCLRSYLKTKLGHCLAPKVGKPSCIQNWGEKKNN